jgi:single-stranded DNA-binding protein
MSAGIEVAFQGRVGTEPEDRLVKGGTMPLLSFSVVVSEGADQEAPGQWFWCAAFTDQPEHLNGRLAEGDKVYLEGKLKTPVETYLPRDGDEARASLEILVNAAQPLGKIGRRRPRQNASHGRAQDMQAPAPGRLVGDTDAAMADLEGR